MNAATVEHHPWQGRRWLIAVLGVMCVQLGLIYWLSSLKGAVPEKFVEGPKVFLPGEAVVEWPTVSNPTQFVLANRNGFSGQAWMNVPPQEYNLPKWTDEQVGPLQPRATRLGSEAGDFLRTNLAAAFQLPPKPEPDFDVLPPPDYLGDPHSILTIEGELANRPLLSKWKLDSWPASDILSNSIVSAAVDDNGNVFSAVLLSSCSSANADSNAANADATALRLASSARFQSRPASDHGRSGSIRLQWGKLVFHWHTIPNTNTMPALP